MGKGESQRVLLVWGGRWNGAMLRELFDMKGESSSIFGSWVQRGGKQGGARVKDREIKHEKIALFLFRHKRVI